MTLKFQIKGEKILRIGGRGIKWIKLSFFNKDKIGGERERECVCMCMCVFISCMWVSLVFIFLFLNIIKLLNFRVSLLYVCVSNIIFYFILSPVSSFLFTFKKKKRKLLSLSACSIIKKNIEYTQIYRPQLLPQPPSK